MAFFRLAVRSISHKAHSYTKSFSLEKAPLDKFRIKYNGNYVKTPSQTTIVVPNSAIGELLLAEWRNDFSPLKERPQPVLFSAVVEELSSFIHTDSIWYRTLLKLIKFSYFDPNPDLNSELHACWDPIIDRIVKSGKLGNIQTSESIASIRQSNDSIERAQRLLNEEFSGFSLAGFEHLVRTFKSFLLPFALYENLVPFEGALSAAQLEMDLQIRKWGLIDDHHTIQQSQIRKNACLGYLFLNNSK